MSSVFLSCFVLPFPLPPASTSLTTPDPPTLDAPGCDPEYFAAVLPRLALEACMNEQNIKRHMFRAFFLYAFLVSFSFFDTLSLFRSFL